MTPFDQHLISIGRSSIIELRKGLEDLSPVDFRLNHSFSSDRFTFLVKIPPQDTMAFFKALATAEQMRICPILGSVSLLIPAFSMVRRRPDAEVAEIADWIARHHDNPFTPFNFRAHRILWEDAQTVTTKPIDTLRKFRNLLLEEERQSKLRQGHHQVGTAIDRLQHGHSPTNDSVREDAIRRLERDQEEGVSQNVLKVEVAPAGLLSWVVEG